MDDVVHRTYNTDPDYWRKYAESLMPKGEGPTGPDRIMRYGVAIPDESGKLVRHFRDKRNGNTHTLCGLPLDSWEHNYTVNRTCQECGEKHALLIQGV